LEQQNNSEWRNHENWKPMIGQWLTLYSSSKNGRIIVPKRNDEIGLTVNAGHPVGKVILFLLAIMMPQILTSVVILVIMRAG